MQCKHTSMSVATASEVGQVCVRCCRYKTHAKGCLPEDPINLRRSQHSLPPQPCEHLCTAIQASLAALTHYQSSHTVTIRTGASEKMEIDKMHHSDPQPTSRQPGPVLGKEEKAVLSRLPSRQDRLAQAPKVVLTCTHL